MKTTVEKVETFLKEHKNAYSVKQIAQYFLMSESAVYFACKTLVVNCTVSRTKKTVNGTKFNKAMAFYYQHKNHVALAHTGAVDEMQESIVGTVLENVTVTWQFKGDSVMSKKFDTMENASEYLAETKLGEHQNIKALVVTANKKRETRLTLRLV
jgi:hypothetical protein